MRERFWNWLRDGLGTTDLLEYGARSSQFGALSREIVDLADEVEKLRIAVADLREQLHMDPMVEIKKLDDYRVPSGDPMGL